MYVCKKKLVIFLKKIIKKSNRRGTTRCRHKQEFCARILRTRELGWVRCHPEYERFWDWCQCAVQQKCFFYINSAVQEKKTIAAQSTTNKIKIKWTQRQTRKKLVHMNEWYDSGCSRGRPTYSSMLNVATNWNETSPALKCSTSFLYVGSGVEPCWVECWWCCCCCCPWASFFFFFLQANKNKKKWKERERDR